MLLKKKPSSNGVRHQFNFKKFLLCKKSILNKTIVKGAKNYQSGRAIDTGRITVFNKGNGSKKLFRLALVKVLNVCSLVISVVYNPRRSSFLSFCYNFLTGNFFYCLTTNNTFTGSLLSSYCTLPELKLGSFLKIINVPAGSIIHSLGKINKFSQYIRSSGNFGVLLQKNLSDCKIKLPSGNIREFPIDSCCVLGSVFNSFKNATVLGKSGRNRLKGKRSIVRGVAMNPVDHPHGGQTSGGMTPVTPWGIPTKGKSTKK
jgi:large subunit ribosomal protein L2